MKDALAFIQCFSLSDDLLRFRQGIHQRARLLDSIRENTGAIKSAAQDGAHMIIDSVKQAMNEYADVRP